MIHGVCQENVMPKFHPIELRERVVAHVEEDHTHRATARHFKVSIKFVNDMVKLKRQTGSLARKPQPGMKGRGKLEPCKTWLQKRVAEQGDITLDQLARELKDQFNLDVHRWSICRVLHQMNLSHKKRRSLPASNIAQM
jgi:transposase